VKKQTFSLWETYKEQCDVDGVKAKKRAFRKTERALKRTCSEFQNNRKTLVLHRTIDDVFSYVVVIENDIVHPSILRNEDVQARIASIKAGTDPAYFS